jgi:hypothetical protein
MSPNLMAELTDKGGARFGSGGFQRKSTAEAGLGGVPNHSELEPSGGVPHRLGGASTACGLRLGLAGVTIQRSSLAPRRTNDDGDFAVSREFLIGTIACIQGIGLGPEERSFFGVGDACAVEAASFAHP